MFNTRKKPLAGKGPPKLLPQPKQAPPLAQEAAYHPPVVAQPPPAVHPPQPPPNAQHEYNTKFVEAQQQPRQQQSQADPAKYVHTTPTPTNYSKIRYFLIIAGFLFATLFTAFIMVMTSSSTNQNHQTGRQPHFSKPSAYGNETFQEVEAYWEFSVTSGLQLWQEIPANDPIPDISAPKGSVQKFEVVCTTVDGVSLTKGVGFDALSFDARLRYLPKNGGLKLLFYANNIQLLQSTCTLFVKIKPQF